MAPEDDGRHQPAEEEPEDDGNVGSLVPFYGVPSIKQGVQAFRRGDLILYTVRGEPEEVRRLMERLREEQVGEVAALITHQVEGEPAPEETPESDESDEGRQ
jgi:hypothetical protein